MLPSSEPYQQDAQAGSEMGLGLLLFDGIAKERLRPGHRRFCSYASCTTTVQAALASLAAVIMLIYICSFAQKGTEHSRSASRKLSEEEAASPGRLGVCGGNEEETDSELSTRGTFLLPLPEASRPTARIAERGLWEAAGDRGAAGPSAAILAAPKKRWLAQASTHPQASKQEAGRLALLALHSAAAEAVEGVKDSVEPAGPFTQQPPPAFTGEAAVHFLANPTLSMGQRERPLNEVLAASALLSLQHTPQAVLGFAEKTLEESQGDPHPSTSYAGISGLASEAGRAAGGTGIYEASPQLQQVSETSHQGESLKPFGTSAVPSRSRKMWRGRPRLPPVVPPPNHSFFRVPTLQPGVVPRPFNIERAIYGVVFRGPEDLLREARDLLAKESLSQEDASMLICVIEQLLAHCYQHHTNSPSAAHMHSVVQSIGFRFLVLDAAVAALHVTQQTVPKAQWEHLVQKIPHTPKGTIPSRGYRGWQYGYKDLALELIDALALLKTGVRPSPEILYRVKRMLFCTEHTVARFRRAVYDPWRADCFETVGSSQVAPTY